MSEVFALKGKRADQERYNAVFEHLRPYLRTDTRIATLRQRIETETQIDILLLRAKREARQARLAGHPVAYDDWQLAAPTGGHIARYMDWWTDERATEFKKVLAVFVEHDLKLHRVNCLGGELARVLYFQMLEYIGILVEIKPVLIASRAIKSGPNRYQEPDHDTVKAHVAMFYRNRIKNPPDSISALAAEFQRDRKAIRLAIDSVIHLLRDIPAKHAV